MSSGSRSLVYTPSRSGDLRLRGEGRAPLQVPCGIVIEHAPPRSVELLSEIVELLSPPLLVSVGDYVTRNLLAGSLAPKVAILDFRIQRSPSGAPEGLRDLFDRVVECENPPGHMMAEAVRAVEDAVLRALRCTRTLVVVRGEEDLLAIPAVLAAPVGSVVVYGLWRRGMVVNLVTGYCKRALRGFVERYFISVSR